MHTTPARNDPCPCGSGAKYKHCHLQIDQAQTAPQAAAAGAADDGPSGGVERAIAWLVERHRKGWRNALEALTQEVLPPAMSIAALDAESASAVQINLTEWLLADGEIFFKGRQRPINELLLSTDGPGFHGAQRHWLQQLGAQALRLYTVTEVRSGSGISVRDALDAQAAPLAVHERSGSRALSPGMWLGARVIALPLRNEFSGAMYPFRPADALEVLRRLQAVIEWMPEQPSHQRHMMGLAIARGWLQQLVEPAHLPTLIDHHSGEPVRLITDHYRVIDASGLAQAMAACADVAGNAQSGWRRDFTGQDGQTRLRAAINPGLTPDRIEIFYSTQRQADEGQAWFDAQAGASVGLLTRKLSDIANLVAGADAPAAAADGRP